jgi:PEP-CTERM motif
MEVWTEGRAMRTCEIGVLICLLSMLWSSPSHAIIVSLDQFTITQGSTTVLNDPFSGASPPPSGPNGANTYIVQGTFPAGSESGGLLQLNSANGVLTANAPETPRLFQGAENFSLLNNSAVLVETGLFNLTIPPGPGFSAYGIRFSDNFPNATPAHPGQLVQLFVEFNATSQQAEIAYILQDFVTHTITQLDSPVLLLLPSGGADQILLTLDEQNAGGSFFGSYQFYKGGSPVSGAGGGGIFADGLALPGFSTGAQEIRGQFFAAQGVPEPGTWLLVVVGMVGLSLARRLRKI